jgi:hypothetical protein
MHVQHAIAMCGKLGVMGDKNKRRSALAMAAEQKIDDLMSGGLIEVSGWLVGDYEPGIGSKGAGDRDALLLAARKFGRIMMQTLRQSYGGQLVFGAFERIARTGELERNGDVLQRRHGRDQVEGLKHDPDMRAAESRQAVLAEFAQVRSGNDDGAGIRLLHSRHHHQQRRLAGAGRSKQRNGLAVCYMQADVTQDMNARGASAER